MIKARRGGQGGDINGWLISQWRWCSNSLCESSQFTHKTDTHDTKCGSLSVWRDPGQPASTHFRAHHITWSYINESQMEGLCESSKWKDWMMM